MATSTIWISTSSTDVIAKGGNPGDHWQRVGVIDSSETDFYTHIQVAIGRRSTSKGKAQFYLNGDPDSEWVQQAKPPAATPQPFWLLVNPYGDNPIHYEAGAIKYLLSAQKAAVSRTGDRHPPTAHPGLLPRPVVIGVRMRQREGRLFIPVRTDAD